MKLKRWQLVTVVGLVVAYCCLLAFGFVVITATPNPTVIPMAVLPPTRTIEPTHTQLPTSTPPPTGTPIPSFEQTITSTPNPLTVATAAKATDAAFACLNASYVKDITIPDGTRLNKDMVFTKTWRVKNTGKCDWPSGTKLSFQSGSQLDAPDKMTIGSLKVGQQVDISVLMRAPAQNGRYKGVWRLQDTTGKLFGEQLTVVIMVGMPTPTPIRVPTMLPPIILPTSPSVGGCPAGASAICCDGTCSFSANRRGTCSHHGGVCRWLR